jgi:hypothetical protein
VSFGWSVLRVYSLQSHKVRPIFDKRPNLTCGYPSLTSDFVYVYEPKGSREAHTQREVFLSFQAVFVFGVVLYCFCHARIHNTSYVWGPRPRAVAGSISRDGITISR